MCLGTLVQDGLAHMRGVTWRAAPAKFKKKGMCEMKVQGQFSGVSLGALAQDGLAQMRGVTWRAVTSKSCLFDMPMLKALAFAMPTRQ